VSAGSSFTSLLASLSMPVLRRYGRIKAAVLLIVWRNVAEDGDEEERGAGPGSGAAINKA